MEELCGHGFSVSTIRRIYKVLDSDLEHFDRRRLEEADSDLILDARYEKVREDGVILSAALH